MFASTKSFDIWLQNYLFLVDYAKLLPIIFIYFTSTNPLLSIYLASTYPPP